MRSKMCRCILFSATYCANVYILKMTVRDAAAIETSPAGPELDEGRAGSLGAADSQTGEVT